MNQQERIDSFIRDYQKLHPDMVVTNETIINNGLSIDRICQYDSERPYKRMRRWLDNKLKKQNPLEFNTEEQNLFSFSEKRKVRKLKTQTKLSLGEILVAYKIGKLSLQDTAFIIQSMYKKNG